MNRRGCQTKHCIRPSNPLYSPQGGTLFQCFPLFSFCREVVTQIQMMNADCILHAALEGDRDQVRDQIEEQKKAFCIG